MRKTYILVSFVLIVTFAFIYLGKQSLSQVAGKESTELVSPQIKQKSVLGINQWFPQSVIEAQTNSPEITAKSGFFMDTKTGQVVYSKNAHLRLPIASLVKIMTALVALEHKKMDDQFLVTQREADMEPDKMLLIAGEKLTLTELLDGIFLVSGNDAAEVLADNAVSDRKEFIKLMNIEANQLGMKDTFYSNPTGLDEDSDNSYSSAYDLALLTRYLIRHYPQVIDISKQTHIYLPQTENHQDYDMYSGINLLSSYPGVVGFKTGYTPDAGLTLITLFQKDGHELIGVLLGSGDRRDEARELLDYSLKQPVL